MLLNKRVAVVLVISVLAADVGYLYGRGSIRMAWIPAPKPTVPLREAEALRTENAALKREVDGLRGQLAGRAAAPPAISTSPTAAPAAVPKPDPVKLLAQARAALKDKQADAFLEAFSALLDAGEGAYPQVISLLQEANWQVLRNAFPDDPTAFRKFYAILTLRASKLGGLMDAILERQAAPDDAISYVFSLSQWGSKSMLPRERQVKDLLALFAPASQPKDPHQYQGILYQASSMLGKLKAVETLPMLEKLALENTEGQAGACAQGIAQMGGPEATAALRRILDRVQDPQVRQQIFSWLRNTEGKEVNDALWQHYEEAHGTERGQLLEALASRADNRERFVQDLRTGTLQTQDRETVLNGLVQANYDADGQKTVWNLYDTEPSLRDGILQRLVPYRDARAIAALTERLQTGQVSDTLAQPSRTWMS